MQTLTGLPISFGIVSASGGETSFPNVFPQCDCVVTSIDAYAHTVGGVLAPILQMDASGGLTGLLRLLGVTNLEVNGWEAHWTGTLYLPKSSVLMAHNANTVSADSINVRADGYAVIIQSP